MQLKNIVFAIVALLFCCVIISSAQIVQHSVISNGGSTSQNTEFHLQSTVGQSIISPIDDYETTISQGFWYTATEEQGYNDNTTLAYRSNMLNINPHPVSNQSIINYTAKEYTSIRVELYSILGERVKELYNAPNQGLVEIPLNTDELSSGQYNIRVTTEQQQQSIMIIVQK
ncbi:MAG: T9SS type A sorting domain-containing protein [Candidatus Kapabacteria bacterium]|nr:T9SS type A sorting domain-containing protein [Candidatus Kapabacteria bacterium]MBX7154924.1 T9SS type A sorting domain-containing protein [Bacteroidota bacterium]